MAEAPPPTTMRGRVAATRAARPWRPLPRARHAVALAHRRYNAAVKAAAATKHEDAAVEEAYAIAAGARVGDHEGLWQEAMKAWHAAFEASERHYMAQAEVQSHDAEVVAALQAAQRRPRGTFSERVSPVTAKM